MGWCSGSGAYEAALGFEFIYNQIPKIGYDNLKHNPEVLEEMFVKAFENLAVNLQNMDWDCEGDVLGSLDKDSPAYKGLALAMGVNLDCPGVCFDISCEGEDYCGCPCHYKG